MNVKEADSVDLTDVDAVPIRASIYGKTPKGSAHIRHREPE